MLKFRESVLLLLALFFYGFAGNDIPQNNTAQINEKTKRIIFSKEEIKRFKNSYKTALDMFKKGSYYSAIEAIYPVLRKPENPYYPYGLLLMSKIYLHIGKKTGKKDFLVKALYFLNTYLYSSKEPTDNWDFYYTRGSIYENLYQYEKALTDYKLSYVKAKSPDEQFKSLIALLRTAAWIKKLDITTRYLILINLEELSKKQKNEFLFVKGLLDFQQGKYRDAFSSLSKVYKEYEQLLIDNPHYYLIVAETAYRYGKLKFAQQLFRRIISTVKDPYIIRRALLRLGDIQLKLKHPVYAFNYYYSIAEKYPESQEAKIAKLKILSAGKLFKEIGRKVNILKEKYEDFEKPFRFIFKMWISNRNNYLGNFALGNFGEEILSFKSEKLFKKFLWEISLVRAGSLKYEHIEYIKSLWREKILNLDNGKICNLYKTNPYLFKRIFKEDEKVISYIAYSLYICGEVKKELEIAEFADRHWNNKKSKLLLSKAYLDNKMYQKAINILKSIKDNSCTYYKIKIQATLLLGKPVDINLPEMENACKSDKEAIIYESLAYYRKGNIKKSIDIMLSIDNIQQFYKKDPFVKKSIKSVLEKLLSKKDYKNAFKLSKFLSEKIKEDCYINSIALISSIRLNRKKEADSLINLVEKCSTDIGKIAKNMYKDYKIFEEIR